MRRRQAVTAVVTEQAGIFFGIGDIADEGVCDHLPP
jgi:hypothetical protein